MAPFCRRKRCHDDAVRRRHKLEENRRLVGFRRDCAEVRNFVPYEDAEKIFATLSRL